MTDKGIQLLCVKEVAVRLSVTHKTAAKLMRTGQLEGFKLSGRYWRTTEVHLEAYVARELQHRRLFLQRERSRPTAA